MTRLSILSALDDPNRAWIVLLVGIVLILRECIAPGRVFPGVFGGLALTVATWSLFQHRWHGWALAVILCGGALLVLQGFRRWLWVPSIAGAILIFVGAHRLLDPPIGVWPAFAAVPLSGITAFLLRTGVLARKNKVSLQ